jgi:two-component system NtrC family sensor kinase
MCSQPPFAVAPGVLPLESGPEWLLHASPRVLAGLTRAAAGLLDASLAVVTVGDAEMQSLLVADGRGAEPRERAPDWVEHLCARVAAADRPLTAYQEAGWRPDAGEDRLPSFVGAPVRVEGRAVGVLAALAAGEREWTEEAIHDLTGLAEAVAAELDRARLQLQREELSARIRESETRYARLSQNAFMGIYFTDVDGRITELNEVAAKMVGRPLEDLVGCDFRSIVAPEDLELAEQIFRQRVTGQTGAGEFELRVLRPTGERRLLQVCATLVLGEDGVLGTHGVARDVTDERSRETQFRRTERMASVAPLLSGVCHELNNPLTSIKSFAELLLLDERTPEDREALEIVQREAHRAAKIVTDLRLVARQSQEMGEERGMVDLSEVVRQVLHSRDDDLAGLEVHLDLAQRLPLLWGIRAQMVQVVAQLVTNAAHAMRERDGRRELTVRTYSGGIGLVLQVEDSGPGIPPDQLGRVFDPFWTTRRPGEGTGLGLSIVHGIVTDHGGRIRVDSTVGSGTRFVVELPVAEQSLEAVAMCDVEANTARPLRILVVDDEAAIRYSVARYLERRGHSVHQAAEGAAALRLLAEAGEEEYDVIVADLRMPGLNGGELLRRLREGPGALEDRLIFITGDTDSSDLRGGVDCAGVPVVQKPFELAEIAQIIETQAGITAL